MRLKLYASSVILSSIIFTGCSISNKEVKVEQPNISKESIENINYVYNIKDDKMLEIFLTNELQSNKYLSNKYHPSYFYGVDEVDTNLLFTEDTDYLVELNAKKSFMNSIPELTSGSNIMEFDTLYSSLFSEYFKEIENIDMYYTPSFKDQLNIILNELKVNTLTKNKIENKMIQIYKHVYGNILSYHNLDKLSNNEILEMLKDEESNKLISKKIRHLNIEYSLNYDLLLPVSIVSVILEEKNSREKH